MENEKLKSMVELMPRKEKMSFLMKSELHTINQLIEMNEKTLNEFTIVGLEATGFKFRKVGY